MNLKYLDDDDDFTDSYLIKTTVKQRLRLALRLWWTFARRRHFYLHR